LCHAFSVPYLIFASALCQAFSNCFSGELVKCWLVSPWRLEEMCVCLNSRHRPYSLEEFLKAHIHSSLVVCSVLRSVAITRPLSRTTTRRPGMHSNHLFSSSFFGVGRFASTTCKFTFFSKKKHEWAEEREIIQVACQTWSRSIAEACSSLCCTSVRCIKFYANEDPNEKICNFQIIHSY